MKFTHELCYIGIIAKSDMESTDSVSWFFSRLGITFLGMVGALVARWLVGKLFREYDRSMLIRLGVDEKDARKYTNAPVIVGRFPFSDLDGSVRSNLDARDVVGFVIGEPKWIGVEKLQQLKKRKKLQDPDSCKPGYYVYCVIQWERAAMVRRFVEQGFHIRRVSYDDDNAEGMMRERVFIGFGTDATPDEHGNRPMVAHIDKGILPWLRYQPYRRGDFVAEDIEMRALTPLARIFIWCGKLPRRCKNLSKKVFGWLTISSKSQLKRPKNKNRNDKTAV